MVLKRQGKNRSFQRDNKDFRFEKIYVSFNGQELFEPRNLFRGKLIYTIFIITKGIINEANQN